jgi:hypothetical protein
LSAWSASSIAIGCYHLTIAEWLEQYPQVGKREGYTPAQIDEYGQYIRLFALRYQPHLLEPKVKADAA